MKRQLLYKENIVKKKKKLNVVEKRKKVANYLYQLELNAYLDIQKILFNYTLNPRLMDIGIHFDGDISKLYL